MFYYMLQNYIGSYLPLVLVHGIDSGEHSTEPIYRKFCHSKYINVAWHFVLHSGVRLVHLEMLNIVRTSCINM